MARVSRRGRHGLQQPPPQDRQAEGWWQTPLAPRSKSSEAGKPQEGTAVGLAANVHPEPCPGWPARLRWNSGSSATLWQRRALGRRQASDGGLGRRARGHTHTRTAAERSVHAGGRAGSQTESETLAQLGADTDVAAAHAQRPRAGRLQTSPNGTHPNAHEEVNDGGSYTAAEMACGRRGERRRAGPADSPPCRSGAGGGGRLIWGDGVRTAVPLDWGTVLGQEELWALGNAAGSVRCVRGRQVPGLHMGRPRGASSRPRPEPLPLSSRSWGQEAEAGLGEHKFSSARGSRAGAGWLALPAKWQRALPGPRIRVSWRILKLDTHYV